MTKLGKILLHEAIDLTADMPWAKAGFTIEPLFEPDTHSEFKEQTKLLLYDCWRRSGIKINDDLPLELYHHHAPDFETHLKGIEYTKLISTKHFPLGIDRLERRISELLKTPLKVLNPWDNQSAFHFRVIRPKSTDNNPMHRDVWLEDYDNCINLYIPIAGSNENSSLTLIPESHHWPESSIERTISGAEVNGIRFNVPAVTKINPAYEIIRPNPKENEVLIFSPYLLHGGAVNLNQDTTRISMEVRLWRKD